MQLYSSLCSLQYSAGHSTRRQLSVSFLSDKLVYQAQLPPHTFRNCVFLPPVAICLLEGISAVAWKWLSDTAGRWSEREEKKKKNSTGKKVQMGKPLTHELRPQQQGKAQWLGVEIQHQGTWQGAILCIHAPVAFLGREGGALGWF